MVVDGEIDAPRGDVSGLAGPREGLFFGKQPNNHRQQQIISPCGATLRHSSDCLRFERDNFDTLRRNPVSGKVGRVTDLSAPTPAETRSQLMMHVWICKPGSK